MTGRRDELPPAAAYPELTRLAGPLARSHRWRRVTSWLARDEDLVRATRLLERALADEPTPLADEQLDALLDRSRARYLCFLLVESLAERGTDATVVLSPRRAAEYAAWLRAAQVDREATLLARQWSAGCSDRVRDSTDVTIGTDYLLVQALLERHYGLFREADG